ncbi:MAG: 1-phosphofructokinase family hexose kinase [Kiritimatiellia bacterium]
MTFVSCLLVEGSCPMILCLGLSPALQRTLVFNKLELNEVNRAVSITLSAGGKSLNTARALATLGAGCKVSGLNGGHNGRVLKRFLDDYGVDSALTPTSAETRICTTLLDETSGSVTELVENAPPPAEAEMLSFIERNIRLVKESRMLVICGTLPPFADNDFYCKFTSVARKANIPFIIDSHKQALLSVLRDKPLMAKLNRAELETTFGCVIDSDEKTEIHLRKIVRLGARSVFMTSGGDEAWLVDEEKSVKLMPPEIDKNVNAIGSGDCTTAGIAFKLTEGSSLEEAVVFGLACGSANAETLLPADISPARISGLL